MIYIRVVAVVSRAEYVENSNATLICHCYGAINVIIVYYYYYYYCNRMYVGVGLILTTKLYHDFKIDNRVHVCMYRCVIVIIH